MTTYETIHTNTAALHYEGPGRHGNHLTIDAAEIRPGCFEIAVLDAFGDDIEIKQTDTLEEAEAIYNSFYRRYILPEKPAAPLTGKYAKLRDDLKAALQAGRNAEAANREDGGACNFDSAAINLFRWQGKKVEQAAKEAGTNCFKWNLYGQTRYVFSPDSMAQANARSRNAEAMTAALRSMGYDAMDYCAMD